MFMQSVQTLVIITLLLKQLERAGVETQDVMNLNWHCGVELRRTQTL